MTSNNEINNNNTTDAFGELKVTNLDLNDNDCCYCVRDIEGEGEGEEGESKATMEDWHQQFNTTDEELMQSNYENCKFQLDYNTYVWTQEELQMFAEQIQIYEASHLASDYDDAVNLWQTHGLSQEQYDAQLVYENAVGELEAYYDLGEEEDPEYETTLKTIIETFEKQLDEDLAARAKADDENDWWMDAVDGNNDFNEDANEDNDEYEDWLEAKREEDMESARQNAIEDHCSF